jgi:AraC-like DNA-binding protein
LGKVFHYIGVQLLPGAWCGDLAEIQSDLVDKPYTGQLDLVHMNSELINLDFPAQQIVFSKLVEKLINEKLIETNIITSKILENFEKIQTVFDMANMTHMSPRQLQRTLKKTTGFSPHDFLKVLRLQQTFNQHYLDYYSDQAHFIHCFNKIIGYTPTKYIKKFVV